MSAVRLIVGALLLLAVSIAAAEPGSPPRFATVRVCVDTGETSLAAWQVALRPGTGAEIVGIGGGDAPFDAPPHYDPAAFRQDELVLAAFRLGEALEPGVHRLAELHVMETDERTGYPTVLEAAGDPTGARIQVKVWSSRGDCRSGEKP